MTSCLFSDSEGLVKLLRMRHKGQKRRQWETDESRTEVRHHLSRMYNAALSVQVTVNGNMKEKSKQNNSRLISSVSASGPQEWSVTGKDNQGMSVENFQVWINWLKQSVLYYYHILPIQNNVSNKIFLLPKIFCQSKF